MENSLLRKIVKQVLDEEYDRTIMTVTVEWMKNTYNRFNKMYWNGELPDNLSFKLNGRLSNSCAYASYLSNWKEQPDGTYVSYIEKIIGIDFSNREEGEAWVFENTMLHEMIHIADYYFHPEHFSLIDKGGKTVSNFMKGGYDPHGDIFFKKEAKRLSQYGWDIQKIMTAEEEDAVTYSKEYLNKKEKAKQAKERRISKDYERYKLLRGTIGMIGEKGKFLNNYVASKTNNFESPMPHCSLNIGPLKIVFETDGDWKGFIVEPDKNDGPNIKYKAVIKVGERLLSSIKNQGFGTGINNVDLGSLFYSDYDEMYDLEDKYGF